MRRVSVVLLVIAATALAAPVALAKTPIPTSAEGSGSEPTAGGGLFAGQSFKAGFADAVLDISFDQLEVFIFPKKVACSDIPFESPPYLEVTVDTDGTPIRVGSPSLANGKAFVQADFHPAKGGGDYAIQPGVSVIFTKVDPAHDSLWHGKLAVSDQHFQGHEFSYDGTFAATWCGKN
jgi:hypothetical protein